MSGAKVISEVRYFAYCDDCGWYYGEEYATRRMAELEALEHDRDNNHD